MKLYDELARWWPLFSPPSDYELEGLFFAQQLRAVGGDPCESVLELGSGGGNNFRATTSDDGARGVRYLEWSSDPDPDDTTSAVDYAVMLRDSDGSIQVEHDRHIEGLFPRATWLAILTDVGFEARVVPFDHSELEPNSHEVFIGERSA